MPGLDQLTKEVEKWTNKKSSVLCKKCKDNCCEGKKSYIDGIKESELLPFLEKDLPIFQLKERSCIGRDRNGSLFSHKERLFTLDCKPLPVPSLIQENDGTYGEVKFRLYLLNDFCPLYNKKVGCTIHNNPNRPETCRKYPIFPNYSGNGNFELRENCSLFNQPDIIKEFENKFGSQFIQLIVKEK